MVNQNNYSRTMVANQSLKPKYRKQMSGALQRTLELTSLTAAASTDLATNVDSPTVKQMNMTIQQIKSGKLIGSDNIPAERGIEGRYRSNCDDASYSLQKDLDRITSSNRLKIGYLIKIPRKEDLSKCENYGGTTLLLKPGKVCN